MLFPKEIIEKFVIIIPSNYALLFLFHELFEILEISIYQFYKTELNEFVFSSNAYAFSSLYGAYSTTGMYGRYCSSLLKKRMNILSAKPCKHVVFNREVDRERSIINFNDLVKKVNLDIPDLKWIHFPHQFNSLRETIIEFNLVELIFSVVGSNVVNTLFMKSEMGLVLYLTRYLMQMCIRFKLMHSLLFR